MANTIESMKRMVRTAQQQHEFAKVAMSPAGGLGNMIGESSESPKTIALRDMLTEKRAHVMRQLNDLDSALAILDANPEIERLIMTIARLGV